MEKEKKKLVFVIIYFANNQKGKKTKQKGNQKWKRVET